jgi:SpoVK/Ycf46/Vps4 family AAA+-type ATPase
MMQAIEAHPSHLPFEVEEIAGLTRTDIAGLDPQVEQLLGTLALNLDFSLAERYRLKGLTSILLHGPPGTGKTLLARVAASELQRSAQREIRWIHLKPSIWKSKYVGETERLIRETFEAIRQVSGNAGSRQHVVVFMDEAESFGRRRGTSETHSYVDDFTNVLLAELDGFSSLQNVSLVAATNRKDLIDPALRERIASIDVAVPRPKLAAARSILEVHLNPDDPWAEDGSRAEAIDAATALIFVGESNRVCKITFNDSSSRTVEARELISGRVLAAIATNARRLAARREAASPGGSQGMEINDVIESTEEAIDSLRTCITRANAHAHIDDLKQDLGVVAVEPLHPKPRRTHPYLNPSRP